ncbi:MAG TPA: 5-dehydro-4-deoxyglucarate dehydratase, partial [Pseudolysinimonas sp.]|nr:5-dehydro-4-deoxyglucarate dehydratase [Pseudolysinimonas sp.]
AGGTGEFFSLRRDDVDAVVRAAVAEAPPHLPIVAPAGYGTRMAVELARQAERAGADAVLLFPPYLVEVDQAGLAEHVRAVCAATDLAVIVYHRGSALYSPELVDELVDSCPNLIGVKDGVGDIELMAFIQSRLAGRLITIGGLPTAETYALPYLELGVSTYSSAIFNFVPEFALRFSRAVRERERDRVARMLDAFVLPYVAIRRRRPGYAVAIVKAGMDAIGRPAGPVLAPLRGLDPADRAELASLIELTAVR